MKVNEINWEKIPKKLIFEQDCTKDVTDGNYFEIGETRVVDAPCGRYREAGKNAHSRFGYRFQIENKQRPHLMVIEYPDDAIRFICVNNGTSYDSTTGVMCGGSADISGEMKTIYNVYWPRWNDDSVVFTSCGLPHEEPAAIASIKVYEIEELPEAIMPEECQKEGNRTFGIQYEDPCNIGDAEGTFEYYKWIERHIEFMKMTGQNHLIYPINWYHGPIVPVESQPNSRFNTVIMEDRKMYFRSAYEYEDWLEDLLTRFDKENMHFTGSMTLMRLGNLFKKWNIDQEAINNGADTINSILFNGQVQTRVNDWTGIYNPLIFRDWVKSEETGEPIEEMAYGEKWSNNYPTPLFNPLHPEVQRQLVEYFEELGEKYGHHKSLDGLQINFWHGTIFWFANLLSGYDDYSFELFEKETGIVSGIEKTDKERFNKRYQWMIENCRKEFVDWRCQKVRELIVKVRDALRRKSKRKDLRLGITVWNETSTFGYIHSVEYQREITADANNFGNRFNNYEMYKDGGLDLELYKDIEGVDICIEHDCARGREKNLYYVESSHFLEDYAYLDKSIHDRLRDIKNTVGFHFNCWIELWGNAKKFSVKDDDTNLDKIRSLPDYKAEYIFHENSTYDDDPGDKFFFDWQLRITSPFYPEEKFIEEMTMDIAIHDALSFTAGGLYLDKAHGPEQLKLAKEYRKLPAVKFNDMECSGPVAARWYFDGEKTYIYAVNREPYAMPIEVDCGDKMLKETVSPFMLKVWIEDGKITPKKAVAFTPEDKKEAYIKRAQEVYTIFDRCDKTAAWAKGMPMIEDMLKKAIEEERFHEARYIFRGYMVQKAMREAK